MLLRGDLKFFIAANAGVNDGAVLRIAHTASSENVTAGDLDNDGDADFLANAYLGEVGNQQLGLNLVQWLASRDAQLNVDVPKAPDTSLLLPGWAMSSITN